MSRILIIAGETSGDLHGSALMREMRAIRPDLSFRGIGGTRMIGEGLDSLRDVREMNFMGFVEVVRHLPFLRRTMRDLEELLDSWKPDLAVLIDYPGFNLKIAPMIKSRGIPVMYYISPQLWAWHESRVKLVRKYVDRMVVLFGFEREFYRRHGIEADFVGHPLLDIVRPEEDRSDFRKSVGAEHVPLIGFLPGSRGQEIRRILPAMAGSMRHITARFSGARGVLGCAPDLDDAVFRDSLAATGIVALRGRTYEIMSHSDVLVVTSGTATLEAGICGTPMVIVYRTSPLTFAIGKRLVKLRDIGLINIVAGSRVVPELHQDEATPAAIADKVGCFLVNEQLRNSTADALSGARCTLGESGAARRAAGIALELLDR